MVCLRHFFNSAFTLVPIQFLRLPDRWVPAKPWQTERINPFPTRLRCKTQQRTNVWRGTHGFDGSLDTGQPEINVSVGASMRH